MGDAIEPPFISNQQVTAFLDVNGRLHLYAGAGIVDLHRLDGADRAAALDQLRVAIDADYYREVERGR